MSILSDPWARLADRLDPRPNDYLLAPVLWTKEKLGEDVTLDQASIMNSVRDNRYTAVQSCHETGKSFTASRIVAWWLDSHPIGEAFVLTTAATAPQVSGILWREIGRAHRKGNLFGYVTGSNEWKINHGRTSRRRGLTGIDEAQKLGAPDGQNQAPELIAIGRKPADHEPTALLGYHARYVLVVIDEACGVPKALFEAIDSLAANENCRVLAIGNPDDPSSYFKTICQPGSGWNVIRLDALRSPGFTKERVARFPELLEYMRSQGIEPTTEVIPDNLYDLLVSPLWVWERMKRWGVDSPAFSSKVRGAFPSVAVDTLIHPHWVTMAQNRVLTEIPSQARLGVDVARYGSDHSIILVRRGGHCRVVEDIPYGPVTELAGKVMMHGHAASGPGMPAIACVDDTGVGGGVTDILEEEGYPHVPIIAGAAATQTLPNGKPRFINKRSELFWNLREALAGPSGTGEDGWLDIDPLDIDLAGQLVGIKYKINRHGQIAVESKDEMSARGIGSPDRADALAYSLDPAQAETSSRVVNTQAMITGDLLGKQW